MIVAHITTTPPLRRGRMTIPGEEKWRECPFGDLKVGEGFKINGKKTMVQSRLFTWAVIFKNDFDRERKFEITEEGGMVTCIRRE